MYQVINTIHPHMIQLMTWVIRHQSKVCWPRPFERDKVGQPWRAHGRWELAKLPGGIFPVPYINICGRIHDHPVF